MKNKSPKRIKFRGATYQRVAGGTLGTLAYEDAADLFGLESFDDLRERNFDRLAEEQLYGEQFALEEGASPEDAEEAGYEAEAYAERELYNTWSSKVERQVEEAADILGLRTRSTKGGVEFEVPDPALTAERIYQTLTGTGLVGYVDFEDFLDAEGDGDLHEAIDATWESALSTAKEVW